MRYLIFALALLSGCTDAPPARPKTADAPVVVAQARKQTVPIQVRAIGSVKSIATVAVRPQVEGQLMEVLFKEGAYVNKGDKLFLIEPSVYEAAVTLAEANLAKSIAQSEGADQELARIEQLNRAVSSSERDLARTASATAKATVAADRAAVNSAKLQLGFTTITAPLDGRVGELLVSPGNLLAANGTAPLVVINQMSPIYVTFSLPEQHLSAVAAAQRISPLAVDAHLRDGEKPDRGTLAFIDNAVNTGSGTVQLKAEFPNADRKLWPGQFVDVVLTVGERPNSVVVPAAAVQAGQQGAFVFVVGADKKAELRSVKVAFEADGMAVIASGLAGDETVVTEGQLRLVSGTPVAVKNPTNAEPAK